MKKRLSVNLNKKNAGDIIKTPSGSLIVGTYEGSFTEELRKIDIASGGHLKKLRKLGELKGKLGERNYLPALPGVRAQRTYIVGCGKKGKKLSRQDCVIILEKMVSAAISSGASNAFISIPSLNVLGEGAVSYTHLRAHET